MNSTVSHSKQLDIFRHTGAGKSMLLNLVQAQGLTNQSFITYGSSVSTWVFGFSGGKDSSAVLTYADWAMREGLIPTPENRIIMYADTLMELPPLESAACQLMDMLADRGWIIETSKPLLEVPKTTKHERFFVNLLGRGYPPPSNRFRWCTDRLKAQKLEGLHKEICATYGDDFLAIDGIRKGESAARDQVILASCSTSDGECGQGWFHKSQRTSGYKLSPILHWRVCHVWDWLFEADVMHGYPVSGVAETYGMSVSDGDEPLSARTGCIGCPLVTTGDQRKPRPDKALETVIATPRWAHLAPYRKLSEIYWQLRWNNSMRHYNKKGVKGCLKLSARAWALEEILKLQSESTSLASIAEVKPYVLIEDAEEVLIRQMLRDRTFPDRTRYPEGFDVGDEPVSRIKQLELIA